ncbi:MAG: hypothetical protein JW846_10830 [Dehalococcoidia bacterium]|nr:hypothetical protein [Dehalococcoidia bacterium]
MTTVIDQEQPQRSQKGKRLLLVIGGSIAAIALIVAGACAIGDKPDEQSTSVPPQPIQGPFIAEASFVLQNRDTLTETELMSWQNLTLDEVVSQGLPFTRYNRYYTRFFLKEGETVQVIMEASVPLGTDLNTAQEGISVMLLPGNAPYEPTLAHDYLPDTETDSGGYFAKLTRAGGNWQISWAIGALESDYYWLMLANTARQDAWCHFTVSVPSG